ncbi:MAG: CIA30 family protein [Planctomycetota bacterium]
MNHHRHVASFKRYAALGLCMSLLGLCSCAADGPPDSTAGFEDAESVPRQAAAPVVSPSTPWFDFADPADEAPWRATTDGVMQDRPNATVSIESGTLIFVGQTTSDEPLTPSARTDFPPRRLAPGGTLELRVKGDGRTYGLEIVTAETIRGRPVRFRGFFETTGDWEVVRVDVADMSPLVYGRRLGLAIPESASVKPQLDAITGLAIVAADRTPGPFRIECTDIAAVSESHN